MSETCPCLGTNPAIMILTSPSGKELRMCVECARVAIQAPDISHEMKEKLRALLATANCGEGN